MRRLVLFIMALAVAGALFAEGTKEAGPLEPIVLGIDYVDANLHASGYNTKGAYSEDAMLFRDFTADLFRKKTGRELVLREIVATGGQTQTIDMVLESGERIDVLSGYAGRMSKWSVPAWALPISDYLSRDILADWLPGALDPYMRNGKLYALPSKGWLQGILINTDMVKKIGMMDKLPAESNDDRSWLLSDFMEMAKRVKDQGLGYSIVLFSTVPSGDYWQQLWLTGFGAELWKDGKIVLDSPEGREAVKWLIAMQTQGYAAKGGAGYDFNEMVKQWKTGRLLTTGGAATGWALEKPFGWTMVLPPSVPGKKGKVIVGTDSALVLKTTKDPRAAVELARVLTGVESQTILSSTCGTYPTIKGVPDPTPFSYGAGKLTMALTQPTIDLWRRSSLMAKDAGVWDAGIPNSAYSKVRDLWIICLQSLFLEKATVDEAVAKFQRDANAFIAAQ